MMHRSLCLAVFGLALGVCVATASAADKAPKAGSSSHSGTVVSAAAGKLVMTGKDNKEHSHDVLATAKIMMDGKTVKLDDLKKGTMITVTTDKDGKVTAITAGTPKAKATKASATKPATTPAKTAK